MSEAVEVLLWGRRIGVASRVDGAPCASFAYDREFRDAGIEPSPLMMPVGIAAYSFPALPQGSFHGLPGARSETGRASPPRLRSAMTSLEQSHGGSASWAIPAHRFCQLPRA